MKSKVVWITSDEAKLITLQEKPEIRNLHKHGARHQPESLGRNHPKHADDTEHFVREVANELNLEQARLLLMGPAQAKLRLKNYLDARCPLTAKNVVGMETSDKMTDAEIIKRAREFFTRLNLYQ